MIRGTTSKVRLGRTFGAVAVALALVVGPGVGDAATRNAAAATREHGRWTVEPLGRGVVVRWMGDERLAIGAERLEVRQGGLVIGYAREVGPTAELRLRAGNPALRDLALDDLELWRGGVRLDVATDQRVDRGPAAPASGSVGRDRPHTRHLPFDAGSPGPFATRRLEYSSTDLALGEFPVPVEVVGEVTLPRRAPGARPLVLILHGRHGSCFTGGPTGTVSGDWPCPAGWQPVPSYRGYRAMTELLASQGYVTVSISANGINAQDFASADGGAAARAALVRHHLALWSYWSLVGGDPFGGVLRGKVDVRRVMLVGHSRGGEGVARAAIESRRADPWRVLGLVPIGSTAFGRQVPATVDTMVLLPRCDGDVSDLQGQIYVDEGRDLLRPSDQSLRSSVLLLGANHNFFNSEWTPGQSAAPSFDDWNLWGSDDDPVCGANSPRRLKPGAQQAAGASYLAIFARLVFARDPWMLAQLDNSFAAPASAKGAAVLVTALGGDRKLIYAPGRVGGLNPGNGLTAKVCRGWSFEGAATCGFDFESRTPHWIPPVFGTTLPAPKAAELRWSGTGRFSFASETPFDLSGKDRIDLRIAIDPDSDSAWFTARLQDSQGRQAWLPVSGELRGLAGDDFTAKVWAQAARLKVRGVTGVDLARITRIDVFAQAGVAGTGTGHAFLLDATIVDQYLPSLSPAWLPKAIIQDREFTEPDAPTIVDVPIRIAGKVRAPGRFWAELVGPTGSVGGWVDVTPSQTSASIPLVIDGDDVHGGDQIYSVVLSPGVNITTGRYFGTIRVVDDELAPTLTAVTTHATGTEATGLSWSLTLSEAQDFDFSVFAPFVEPGGGTEVDSDDVPDDAWAVWVGADKPIPAQTLSSAFAFQFVRFDPGSTSVTVTVPFVADGVAEGPEHVAIDLWVEGRVVLTLTGTVTDS